MTHRTHEYELELLWTGNLGAGTASSTRYRRRHGLRARDAPAVPSMAGPAFRGEVPEKCFIDRSLAFPVRHEPVALRDGQTILREG